MAKTARQKAGLKTPAQIRKEREINKKLGAKPDSKVTNKGVTLRGKEDKKGVATEFFKQANQIKGDKWGWNGSACVIDPKGPFSSKGQCEIEFKSVLDKKKKDDTKVTLYANGDTPEQAAKRKLLEDATGRRERAEEFADFEEKQEEDARTLDQKIKDAKLKAQRQRDEDQRFLATGQEAAQVAATRGGRTTGVAQDFSGQIGRLTAQQTEDIKVFDEKAVEIRRLAQRAADKGLIEKEKELLDEAKTLEEERDRLTSDAEDRKTESQKASDSVIKNVLTDDFLVTATDEQITSIFSKNPDATTPLSYALGRKSLLVALQDAIKSGDETKIQSAQAALGILEEEASAKETIAQDDFNYYTDLLKTNPDLAEKFALMKGITEKDTKKLTTIKVGDDVYSFDAATGESKKIVDGSGNNDIQPTGETITRSYAGRNVTLDSGAMAAFSFANNAAVEAGVGEIKIGGTETSSTRDQAATISGMVTTWNNNNPSSPILFDPNRPNDAAAALRIQGISVANVGASKHEHGLALDIFPDHNYIAKVKPFLEANGWKQTIPKGDAGHFEFQGVTEKEDTSELAKFKRSAIELGLSGEKAQKFAEKRLEESFKPLTEAQGKALKATQVATEESKLYDSVVSEVSPEDFADAINVISTTISDASTPLTGEIVNRLVVEPNVRRAIMSEARWLGAVLREESGAAISVEEYLTKGGAFFPRAGDDALSLKDKERARKTEARSLLSKIGPAGQRKFDEFIKDQEEVVVSQAESDDMLLQGRNADGSSITPEDQSEIDNIFE